MKFVQLAYIRFLRSRVTLPLLALFVTLQKSPVIRIVAEVLFSSNGRLVQPVSYATVVVAAMVVPDAVSGASGDTSPASSVYTNPTTVEAGSELSWAIRVQTSSGHIADKWELRTLSGMTFPLELSVQVIGNNVALVSGSIAVAGTYGVNIVAINTTPSPYAESVPYPLTIEVTEAADLVAETWGPDYMLSNDPPWAFVDWFGWIWTTGSGWMAVQDHGWVYVSLNQSQGNEIYFYDLELGWCFTNKAYYSNIWVYDRAEWLEFYFGTFLNQQPPRWFLDYDAGGRQWVSIPLVEN